MTERIYRQRCPIARALDVVGERWALLIVRELSLGPQRYNQLAEALPAMGTKVLAERLKELVARDVIAATDRGYVLTERGAGLRPVLQALAVWGAPTLAHEREGDSSPVSTIALLLLARAMSRPREKGTTIQLRIDGRPFVLTLADRDDAEGHAVTRGEAERCEGTLSVSVGAAIELLDGRTTMADEIEQKTLSIEDLSRRRLATVFGFRSG